MSTEQIGTGDLARSGVAAGPDYDAWLTARARGDEAALAALLHPRWCGVDQHGSVHEQAGLQSFLVQEPRRATLGELVVQQHGDVRITRGVLDAPDEYGAHASWRFMALWVPGPNGLRCLAHHETRVVDSAFADKPLTERPIVEPPVSMARPETIAELAQIYDDLHVAMPQQDYAYLDEVIADTWFTTDPGGELRDKGQYMQFARDFYAPTLVFHVSELFVREVGSFAAVSCRYSLSGRFRHGVAPNQAVRVSGFWRRDDDRWHYVAQQGSFIP
jgi:ketosteroid isomerase-like protein